MTLVIRAAHAGAAIVGLATVFSAPAWATESGGGIYPNGAENYMVAAMPPPGLYYLVYASYYEAGTLRDNSGNKVPVDFKVTAAALAPRLIWVTNQQLLGGQLAFHAIAPLVDLKVRVAGASDSETSLGDMTVGTALGYHLSPNLHYVLGVDLNVPTGQYDKTHLANVGRHYWNLEPLATVTYVQDEGFNGDLKLMYDFNRRNTSTDYRSGQEFHADYDAGWGFGNGWTAGVGGYVYQQTTKDKLAGATVADNRGRALSAGPSIKYDSGHHWFVTVKYEKEFSVRNRPEGGGLNVKAVLPF